MLQKKIAKLNLLVLLATLLAVSATMTVAQTVTTLKNQRLEKSKNLNRAFEKAAIEFDVPSELLKAIAFSETHFDNHNGEPSHDNGYGIMHLADNNENQSLNRAAAALGVPAAVLKLDNLQNVRGGAAILQMLADEKDVPVGERKDAGAWYEVVALYSNAANPSVARLYADEVYKLLQSGFSGKTPDNEELIVVAREVNPRLGSYAFVQPLDDPSAIASPDYDPALWVPANAGNYTASSRPTAYPINYVVIHTTQGSYSSAINWFQNAAANVSAHYVIRSSDGQITQTVREKDVAYHAGNWTYNTQSIGIEHEGFVSDASWYTDAMYRASAALTRNVCLKYGIPMTRARIIGHSEVPNATHTDPGPNWNWTYYMQLVTGGSAWETIVDNATGGQFTASGNWDVSSYSTQKYGANYRVANPQPVSDAAWFAANIPSAGNYQIYVWYPANSGYNSSTPFVVATASGNQVINVNQQINGGTWVSLGTFNLNAGNYNVVGVSRWTNTGGYVIADAVKIVRR